MFFASLISSFYLLFGPAALEPAFETIQIRHLETPEGRIEFLNGKLRDFVSDADRLNEEILALSAQIQDMDMENPSDAGEPEMLTEQMHAMAEELNGKMGTMLGMLPMLQHALKIDADFQRIDTILNQQEPLGNEEKEILNRIASLCDYVDSR